MCMLNGKTSFPIPNVPADHKLLRFNVLFAHVFEAVSGGKGMLNLKIDPSKQQTISNLLNETFPAIECYDNEKLHVINPKIIAYIHALVIDCITMAFSDSINSRALEHESAMVEVYSQMKPDAFRSQLQTVLTTYYEDIKGIVSASGCTKSKVIKRKFEDQDNIADAEAAPDPRTPPVGEAAPAPSGEEPPPASSPGGKSGGGKGRGQGVPERVLARPKADAD